MFRNPSVVQRYGVAIGAVLVAFVTRYTVYGTLDHRLPFAFFTISTLIAAWFGGLGPGLLAAVAGLLLGDYFFLPPHQSEALLGEAERTVIGTYALTNTLIVVLFWNLHSRLRDLEDSGGKPGV